MGTTKVSVTLDANLVIEAKSQVGEREFSRYLNEALSLRLQRARLERLERELTEEFGPIPEAVQQDADSEEWPR